MPLFSLRSPPKLGHRRDLRHSGCRRVAAAARQTVLQILPLNELAPGESSPYSALSAMAIDPQFITIGSIPTRRISKRCGATRLSAMRQAPSIEYGP